MDGGAAQAGGVQHPALAARYVARDMLGDEPKALLVSDRYAVCAWMDA